MVGVTVLSDLLREVVPLPDEQAAMILRSGQ